jgi:hypothetical protein
MENDKTESPPGSAQQYTGQPGDMRRIKSSEKIQRWKRFNYKVETRIKKIKKCKNLYIDKKR